MNKTELVVAAAGKSHLPATAVEKVVNSLVDILTAKLSEGEKIQLLDFGTFEVRQRSERKGRHPRTGEEIMIAATNTPAFIPGKTMKNLVNEKTFIDDFLEAGKIDEEEAQALTYVFEESRRSEDEVAQIDTSDIAAHLHMELEEAEEVVNALIRKRILNTRTYYGSTDSVYLRARWRKYL